MLFMMSCFPLCVIWRWSKISIQMRSQSPSSIFVFFGTRRWSAIVSVHVKVHQVKTSAFARALICSCGSFFADKTIKLWKISERDKRPEGYNLKEEDGRYRDPTTVTTLRVSEWAIAGLTGGQMNMHFSKVHVCIGVFSSEGMQAGMWLSGCPIVWWTPLSVVPQVSSSETLILCLPFCRHIYFWDGFEIF